MHTTSFKRWHRGITSAFNKLACTQLLEQPSMFIVNKRIIKSAVRELWLTEGGASAADLDCNFKFTRQLRDLNESAHIFDSTSTVHLNVRTDPLNKIALHTQVIDIRKYGGTGNAHLFTTGIKRCEQEALSLFRTGVAPRFVRTSHIHPSLNRFERTCAYCSYVHGSLHVDDAFHTLFICPLFSPERAVLWTVLDTTGGANEWEKFASVVDLGTSLLCPQVPIVASAVGRYLSECLGARELYVAIREGRIHECTPRWLRGRTSKLNDIYEKIYNEYSRYTFAY